MKWLFKVLLWIWQFPQNIIGYFLTRKYEYKEIHYTYKWNRVNVWYCKGLYCSGVCLGDFILLDTRTYWRLGYADSITRTVSHEYGHSRQSLILGWLYLPLVGLPSIIGDVWDRLFHKNWTNDQRNKWYYSRYPENWADRLGGVVRD